MPFVTASAVAIALVLAAPFIGEIRRAILARFPGQFVRIVGAVVAVAVAAALIAAFARIRDRRGWRYGAIAAALAIAAGYALVSRTGDPQVDAVERFHFVEYGLVTLLFYRAWRPAGDLSVLVLPILAGLLVGTFEEWFQWFIPARVGDVRDILLNGIAIGCGLLFSVALDPPPRLTGALPRPSLRRIGAFAAVVVVAFAAFFQTVHVGHAIDGGGWSFRSGYTADALDRLSADRAARWQQSFIPRPPRLSAEDQYMTEGLWHVQHRNKAWEAGAITTAWYENRILERYFAPVLDSSSYVSRSGHRWGAEHRAEAERRFAAAAQMARYESDAHPAQIRLWRKRAYWMVVGAVVLILALPLWIPGRSVARLQDQQVRSSGS
jgi:hypothetical protein